MANKNNKNAIIVGIVFLVVGLLVGFLISNSTSTGQATSIFDKAKYRTGEGDGPDDFTISHSEFINKLEEVGNDSLVTSDGFDKIYYISTTDPNDVEYYAIPGFDIKDGDRLPPIPDELLAGEGGYIVIQIGGETIYLPPLSDIPRDILIRDFIPIPYR